jgi:pyrimidine oxygenase
MARYADYNFCIGKGINTPRALAGMVAEVKAAALGFGRRVEALAVFVVIAEETDEAAFAKWEHYKAGADLEALDWLASQTAADTRSGSDTNVRQYVMPETAVSHGFGMLIGSFASVADMLDELDDVEGLGGVMLVFDDFVEGVEAFGRYIQPRMRSRRHIQAVPTATANCLNDKGPSHE